MKGLPDSGPVVVTLRARLREELTRRYVPALQARGFEGPARIAGNELFHEFRRRAGPEVHVLSTQFEKHQRPRFVLNVWIESVEVYRSPSLRVTGRVQPRPGPWTCSWFRADNAWWQRLLHIGASREQEAVSEAITLLDEIEAWYRTRVSSQHVRIIGSSASLPAPHGQGRYG